jgi:hypothetical protein
VKALVVAVIVCAAGVAHADEPMRNTVSLGVPALFERGLAVEGERDMPEWRVSIAAALAMRASAGGDYGSFGAALGAEGRYWILRRAIWSARPRGDAIGWYVGARIDLAHTRVTMDGERIGAERQLALGLVTGYRFAPWRGLEVRPYTGIAWRREWDPDGRLPPWSRGGLVLGFALGWSW